MEANGVANRLDGHDNEPRLPIKFKPAGRADGYSGHCELRSLRIGVTLNGRRGRDCADGR
jgi:hypothetical protein